MGRYCSCELLGAHETAADEVVVEFHADPRAIRDLLHTVHRIEHDAGHVLVPVTAGAGGIARQDEVLQAAQVQVVGAADAGFKHPTTPYRCAEGERYVVNATRLQRSEEHTSELQSRGHLVCRLLLEKENTA